jgi:hypothetical protein
MNAVPPTTTPMMILVVSASSSALWLCGAEVGVPVLTSIRVKSGSTVGDEMVMTVAEVTVVEPELTAREISSEDVEAAVYLAVSNRPKVLTAAVPFAKPARVRDTLTVKEILALEVARDRPERPAVEPERRRATLVTELMLMSPVVTDRVSAVSLVKAVRTPASTWASDRPVRSVDASI